MDIQKLRGFLNTGFLLLLITDMSLASDLIEPTRTLNSTGISVGALTVSSEPPGLDVRMDGTVIGETPVELQAVAPGIHVIQVKDSEIEIYVDPGKSIKLSWFKGAFIKIPAEVKESHKQQIGEKKEAPRKEKPEQSAKKMDLQPLYWPLNPRGPIY
ncbi:MAG: PEGA domain-containing protein [Desulfobacterales bacterium]